MFLVHSCRRPGEIHHLMYDENVKPDAFLLLNYQEWQYNSIGDKPSFEEIVNYCNKKNIPFYIINGSVKEIDLYNKNDQRYNVIQPIIRLPYYFLQSWYRTYKNNINFKSVVDNDISFEFNSDFKHLFISLNSKPHPHRCRQIDILVQHDLLKYGAVSWNSWEGAEGRNINQNVGYEWRFWKPELLILDDPVKVNHGWSSQIPKEFNNSFIQLISESSTNALFFTEKIVPSLIFTKIFLVSGPKDYHNTLKEWGFELYDEIFDYSFDSEIDDETRFQKLTKNLINLKHLTQNEMQSIYERLIPKLIHNKNQLEKIATDVTFFPEFLLNLFEKNDSCIVNEDIYHFYLDSKK